MSSLFDRLLSGWIHPTPDPNEIVTREKLTVKVTGSQAVFTDARGNTLTIPNLDFRRLGADEDFEIHLAGHRDKQTIPDAIALPALFADPEFLRAAYNASYLESGPYYAYETATEAKVGIIPYLSAHAFRRTHGEPPPSSPWF